MAGDEPCRQLAGGLGGWRAPVQLSPHPGACRSPWWSGPPQPAAVSRVAASITWSSADTSVHGPPSRRRQLTRVVRPTLAPGRSPWRPGDLQPQPAQPLAESLGGTSPRRLPALSSATSGHRRQLTLDRGAPATGPIGELTAQPLLGCSPIPPAGPAFRAEGARGDQQPLGRTHPASGSPRSSVSTTKSADHEPRGSNK